MDLKQLVTSWKLWLTVSMLLAIILLQKDGVFSALFPYAAVLICPLMMMFMMHGNHRQHDEKGAKHDMDEKKYSGNERRRIR